MFEFPDESECDMPLYAIAERIVFGLEDQALQYWESMGREDRIYLASGVQLEKYSIANAITMVIELSKPEASHDVIAITEEV